MIDTETDITTAIKCRNGELVVKRVQATDPYAEINHQRRREFSATQNGYQRPIRMVADVPNIVIEQWLKMGVNIFDRNDAKKVRQLLNSNEYSKWRTSPGKCKVL